MIPYRVLVVEDQAMPRQLFEMFIHSSEQFKLAASIDNAALADVYCAGGGIDLILMDVVTKNGANGLEAAETSKTLAEDPNYHCDLDAGVFLSR